MGLPGWIAVGAAVALAFALVAVIVLYERELRFAARRLEGRDEGSNERLAVDFRTRGTLALARAANALIDAEREAHARDVREKKAFREDLASLSHDIRTPLAGAQGYLELYERLGAPEPGVAEPPGVLERRARYTAAVRERLDAMRVLVDGLFEYTKALSATDAPLIVERVTVLAELADVLAALYPQFERRGWEPRVDFEDEGAEVAADREAFGRVCSNLLVNALQHGSGAPSVTQRGRRVTFSNEVADPGAIDVGRLFERFYRADASRGSGDAGGANGGLGLAIVAQLCVAMGIDVVARLEGSVLSIDLELPVV